ncbi:MAG: hypothetical protein ACKPKO_42235, partial [Candidatus Fonsibacter sp.]
MTIPEVVLRDTFLANIRKSKRLAPDIVEFDRMREGDPKRTIKWLIDSIDRVLSRDRMEWARELRRKSLLNGASDADVATPGKGFGKKGKSKGKSKSKDKAKNSSKGNSKGNRDSSRESSSTSLPKGPCYSCIKTGECTKTHCPYDHYSSTQMEQIKKALGHGNSGGREQS